MAGCVTNPFRWRHSYSALVLSMPYYDYKYLISNCCDCSWFNNKGKAARRKLEWEDSLEHDSRKDQFVQSLSAEDRQAYYASHHWATA